MKRDRTPSLWLGGVDAATAELPRGQGSLPFPPEVCGDDYGGFLPPCIRPKGHKGRHTSGLGASVGLVDSWGTLTPEREAEARKLSAAKLRSAAR